MQWNLYSGNHLFVLYRGGGLISGVENSAFGTQQSGLYRGVSSCRGGLYEGQDSTVYTSGVKLKRWLHKKSN